MAPFYRYIGDSGRDYPIDGYLPFNVGDVVDFANIPGNAPPDDGRWTTSTGPATVFPVTTATGAVPVRAFGTLAQRPDPGQLPNQRYFATDVGEDYFSDGINWYGAGVPTFTRATSAPSNPATNDLWYDETNDIWKRWNGAAWTTTGSSAFITAETVGPYLLPSHTQVDPITRAGSCMAIAKFLRGVLKGYGGSTAINIITDSTGTDTSALDGPGWVTYLTEWLAATYPTLRLRRRDWDATNLVMGEVTVIQEGNGPPYFTIGANSSAFLYKPYGSAGLLSGKSLWGNNGDIDVRIKLRVATVTGRASNMGLLSNFGPTTSQFDNGLQFRLQTDNTLLIKFGNSSGTSAHSWGSTAPVPFVAEQWITIRATVDKDNGAGGATATFYYRVLDGDPWTQLGAPVVNTPAISNHGGNDNWVWQIGGDQVGAGQTITINGSPTSGTFTLTMNSTVAPVTTGPITLSGTDATTATNMQTAIQALGGIYADATVAATGTAKQFTVTFSHYPGQLSGDPTNLTGGTGVTIGVSITASVSLFDCAEVQIRKGINGPIYGPTQVSDWQNDAGGSRYFGGPQLDVINGAWASHSIIDFVGQPFFDYATPHFGQVLTILATSHNEGVTIGSVFSGYLDQLKTALNARSIHAALMVVTENPRVPPAGSIWQQTERSTQLAAWGQRNGATVIDTFSAMLADPRWTGVADDTLMTAGGVHPKTVSHQTIIAPLYERAILTGS